MVSRLEKHGDSQALVLDNALLELLHIDADTPLQVQVSDGALIVTPLSAGSDRNTTQTPLTLQSGESASLYPAPLMREYHALTDKKIRQSLTPAETARLREARSQIAALDEQQVKPDTWDMQAQKLRDELAQIRAEVEALRDKPPARR